MSTQIISYKYRIYPKQNQIQTLFGMFSKSKEIYNELLTLNIETYKKTGKGVRKFDYNYHTKGREGLHSQVIQNISDRVNKAFQNFFRRVKDKSCKEKGFPRFKSSVYSIIYPQSGFRFLSQRRLKVSRIGSIPIVLHRVPKGKIKTLTIKKNRARQWFAFFSCEVEVKEIKHVSKDKVGIDVGIENFATLSNGEVIANPQFFRKSEKKLARLQRRLSRKKKGSANRRKARLKVARCHLKIENQRSDFLHKLSHTLTKRYSFIAIEQLTIKNMVRNHHLAKSINDVAWGSFFQFLSYKAVICGGKVAENPKTRGSSQRCSKCGTTMKMPLSKRIFKCLNCGFVVHRDYNASLNMLNDTDGLSEISTPVESLPLPSSNGKACELLEAGTILEPA